MDTTPSPHDSSGNTELQSALSDWLHTLTLFRAHFNRLATRTNTSPWDRSLPNQCPFPDLTELLAVMQGELVLLLLEMEQVPHPTTTQQEVKRLWAHTARLAALNQQASQFLTLGSN